MLAYSQSPPLNSQITAPDNEPVASSSVGPDVDKRKTLMGIGVALPGVVGLNAQQLRSSLKPAVKLRAPAPRMWSVRQV